MGLFHFLNVNQGDCSIIEHVSKRVSVIDVNCAFTPAEKQGVVQTEGAPAVEVKTPPMAPEPMPPAQPGQGQ